MGEQTVYGHHTWGTEGEAVVQVLALGHADTLDRFGNAVPLLGESLEECGVLGYGHGGLQIRLLNYSVLND